MAISFAAMLPALAQITFSPLEVFTNREARVRLTVPAGTFARVDASTNLLDWSGYLTTSGGSLIHTDVFAPYAPLRYYRATQVTNSGTFAGDHIPTTNGDVVIRPVTHASFVMSWNGKMIYNDPDTASYAAFPKADLILVGHEHSDHFDAPTIAAVKSVSGIIIAPQTVYNSLSATLKASTIVLNNNQSTNVLGIDVLAVAAYNSYHPQGVGNGYVLTMGGKKFYMTGDTSATTDIQLLTGLDVAFVCMNQPFTMTASEAASVIRGIRPKIVYPYHYRSSDGSVGNPVAFKAAVGTDLGIEVRLRNWYP
jgi:L-ascorbate metabolism protein UlaG (beta-lactamase superfamily)